MEHSFLLAQMFSPLTRKSSSNFSLVKSMCFVQLTLQWHINIGLGTIKTFHLFLAVNKVFSMVTLERHQTKSLIPSDGRRESRSFVWRYCQRLSSLEAICKICGVNVPTTGGNTSGVRNHLQRAHQLYK